MILPETIPLISEGELRQWRSLKYSALAEAVLRKFLGLDNLPKLKELCENAFGGAFGVEPVSVSSLRGCTSAMSLHVMELWRGPSLAFKDLGMQLLCQTLEHYMRERGERRLLLVATSGDTGPSAMLGVQSTPSLDVLVLYPKGRVSRVQEVQMVSAAGSIFNAHLVACEGTSDDLDVQCANIFDDKAFVETHSIGTVNSVNIMRVLGQIIYYFWGYFRVTACEPYWQADQEESGLSPPQASFSVPTGAGGNVTAGFIAAKMGLPVERLIVAVNSNDTFDIMFKTGVLQSYSTVVQTSAPAMDIGAPYNCERLLYLITGGDDARVKDWIELFCAGDSVVLPATVQEAFSNSGFTSSKVDDEGIADTIRLVHTSDNYVLDPHTAVGVTAALSLAGEGKLRGNVVSVDHCGRCSLDILLLNVVCIGCAHPAKFPETVAEALGVNINEAVKLMPEKEHPPVTNTLKLTLATDKDKKNMLQDVPMFKRGEDWQVQLKKLIESVTTERRAQQLPI
ncbi:unnamed protein product [Choristocarpus tenellus]